MFATLGYNKLGQVFIEHFKKMSISDIEEALPVEQEPS